MYAKARAPVMHKASMALLNVCTGMILGLAIFKGAGAGELDAGGAR